MIKLRDNQGNVVSTIKDDGEMEFDNKRVEEEFNKACVKQSDKIDKE